MNRKRLFIHCTYVLLLACAGLSPLLNAAINNASQTPIVILVPPIVLENLKTFLRPNESAETFNDYARKNNYRDLTDYLLLRRALALGGNQHPIGIRPWISISYERVLFAAGGCNLI